MPDRSPSLTYRSETDPWWRTKRTNDSSELREILDRFSGARSVIATACSALNESDDCIDEAATIGAGLEMLAGVYNELDSTIVRMRSALPPRRRWRLRRR